MGTRSYTKASTIKEKLICNTLHISHSKYLETGTQKYVEFKFNRTAETKLLQFVPKSS